MNHSFDSDQNNRVILVILSILPIGNNYY